MKWYQIFAFIANILAALYFLYFAAMHVFVYAMNKKEGHYVSFHESGIYLSTGGVISILTILAWYAMKNPGTQKLGNLLLYIPLGLVVAYGLFAIFILLASGGKWN